MNNKTAKSKAITTQTHVHEVEQSTMLAEQGADRHNHRFAGVTDQVIPVGKTHVHLLSTKTDFLDHFHRIIIITGPAIAVSRTKHVHLVRGNTTFVDGHRHPILVTTQINSPLVP